MAAESTAKSKKSKKKTSAKSADRGGAAAMRREAGGLILLLLALGVFLSLASFDPGDLDTVRDPSNLIGPVGVHLGDALLHMFGVGAFGIDFLLFYLGFCLILGRPVNWKPAEIGGQFVFVVFGAVLCHLAMFDYLVLGHLPGGMVGEFVGELARAFVGSVGAMLLAIGGVLLGLMLATQMSLGAIVRWFVAQLHRLQALMVHKVNVHRAYRARLAEERAKLRAANDPDLDEQARAEAALAAAPIVDGDYEFQDAFEDEVESKLRAKLGRLFGTSKPAPAPAADPKEDTAGDADRDSAVRETMEKVTAEVERDSGWEIGDVPVKGVDDEPEVEDADPADFDEIDEAGETAIEVVSDSDVIDMSAEKEPANAGDVDVDFGPAIVESAAARKARERQSLLEDDGDGGVLFKPQRPGNYELPPINYLNYDKSDGPAVDADALRMMAAQIEQCLADFKVEGNVVEICPGPVITMFEFSPAPGVRVSKISNLSDDLAMALSALSVRIVAPIPGKGVVGIEVPNPSREMVWLKEIIADDIFAGNKKAELPMALGVDVEGEGVVADLARMPHLLVAGATGSGKSVAVNTMICSLLYRHTPDDVRFIMVDPKMLEFSVYADIPHLLLPVVTDPKQATVALNWAVNEMERRYQALADLGVRNIKGYNAKVERLTKQAELDQLEGREETEALKALGIDSSGNPDHKHLPYIVVIIDEFADLMMTAAKDVEQAVARLAQKARAAGIHLILATQRPSTDVITGLIKANFPTRFALRVTSKTDSRVILDGNGAENLLGNGDALFVPPGTSTLKRVHGAYVSEEEISKVVDFLKVQGEPKYDDSILVEEDEESASPLDEEWEKDEYYEDAVRLVCESGQASISMIQRKLRVGYNRAARMVETMERENLVSAADGCKPREVLVDESPY
jgi:S-DNA-T family DNA segregation ATPase FtsK/SpoIIIE